MIYEAAMSGTVEVTPGAWARAEWKARDLEEMLFKLFQTNFTNFGYQYERAVGMIQRDGKEGVSRSDFCKVFQEKKLRIDIIKQLYATSDALLVTRETGKRGSKPMFWVHKDYCDGQEQVVPLRIVLATLGEDLKPAWGGELFKLFKTL